jgi:hypothetical protein
MKIDAAKKAAGNLLDVIGSEQSAFSTSTRHEVGLVSFSDYAETHHYLTENVSAVKDTIRNFLPTNGTAMAAGLNEGANLFDQGSAAKKILILMSDGVPTTPLDDSTVYDVDYDDLKIELIDLASQVGAQGICVYTVGFGIPNTAMDEYGSIDEQLLRDIAAASTCGEYYNAQNAGELANIFLQLRHASLGRVLLQESGEIAQDEEKVVGNVSIPQNQEQMLFTLNWPGSKLTPKVYDPKGNLVTQNYSGATVTQGETVSSLIVLDPIPGVWTVRIVGTDVPGGMTTYNALMSIRGSASTPTPSWMWLMLVPIIMVTAGVSIGLLVISRRKRPRRGKNVYLMCTKGPMQGTNIPLRKQTVIGRGNQGQVIIHDKTVSRAHVYIQRTDAGWLIQDLGSTAGLSVNGREVQASYLKPGDRITLGNSSFIFMA